MQTLNWDDLRVFLAIARHGGLLAAARRLNLDHTTVARRLSALEIALGARLVHRSPRGARLTDAGLGVLEHAERIEAETRAARSRFGPVDEPLSGVVRLATPEAFGAYLVAPNAAALHARHPHIQLELVPEARASSLTKREADLSVSVARPQDDRLLIQKLTDYRLGIFAAARYLRTAPPITDLASIKTHPFVWYIDELIDIPELRYLDQVAERMPTAFRSSSIVAQHNAVAAGLGLGILHSFAAEVDPRLAPVLADSVAIVRTYWLTMHADQRHLPRIRAVKDFLHEITKGLGRSAQP